jgi:myo-inositol-1(or 4)-monophosphatase
VACNRFQACTFLGEAAHDVAAGTVIAAEAGCAFGTIDGRVLSPSEMVAETPVKIPTLVSAPRRLRALMAMARRL